MKAIACPDCFSNFGLKQTALAHSATKGGRCPQCGSASDKKLDADRLGDATVEFFVGGSYIAETFAPVYQANDCNPNPAKFDPTLSADAELINRLSGLVVFHYGPPLWRLGMTNHYYEFDAGGHQAKEAAEAIVKDAPQLILEAGTRLFRVRRNFETNEDVASAAAFDPPPPHIERESGRWDSPGHPALYVSDDLELCLHECRVVVSDEIVAATLSPTRQLKLLDLTKDIPVDGGTPFDDPNIFIRVACISRGDWLGYCRHIAIAAKSAGFDGIKYPSYYSQAKHDNSAVNLALFGRPIADGMLAVESVNRVRLTDMKYQVAFGPVVFRDKAMREELAKFKAMAHDFTEKGLESYARELDA